MINEIDPIALKNKIVLVGYVGPGKEDKYYSPYSLFEKNSDEGPDMYGLVIIANEIRTLLDYSLSKVDQ